MGRVRTARQGDFLGLMEPGPTLAPAVRTTLIPLLAALLFEAAEAGLPTGADKREAGDDQDRG